MANIKEIQGNIFESSCNTIVNTINCVGKMGKGIAYTYKLKYPEMYKNYEKLCEAKVMKPGLLQLWKKSSPWILNFPTKNHWKDPSKIEYIELGLQKFSVTYEEKGITSIAFPELGTASGGLNWQEVEGLMYRYLEPLGNLDIEIYHFDPSAKDTFFDKLIRKIHRFEVSDYKTFMNIPKQQAQIIIDALKPSKEPKIDTRDSDVMGFITKPKEKNTIHSMLELQNLHGVGEKTFEKIYEFVNSDGDNRLVTEGERQTSFNF